MENNGNEQIVTFECECGCKLIFEDYSVGCDIYVGERGIISHYQMVGDYSWADYLPRNTFWHELKAYIVQNYVKSNLDDGVDREEELKGWIHLYNRHCVNDSFNGNDKLSYEHVY